MEPTDKTKWKRVSAGKRTEKITQGGASGLTTRKNVYEYQSTDGRFTIKQCGRNPLSLTDRRMPKIMWKIWDNKENPPQFWPSSYRSVKKAGEAVEL
ncbi:MAG: hypothetical protein KKB31_07580, partial [Nanoarchaeota archaeon]|nr:hypothetical protein [Nanoarchaeota archaeon]